MSKKVLVEEILSYNRILWFYWLELEIFEKIRVFSRAIPLRNNPSVGRWSWEIAHALKWMSGYHIDPTGLLSFKAMWSWVYVDNLAKLRKQVLDQPQYFLFCASIKPSSVNKKNLLLIGAYDACEVVVLFFGWKGTKIKQADLIWVGLFLLLLFFFLREIESVWVRNSFSRSDSAWSEFLLTLTDEITYKSFTG